MVYSREEFLKSNPNKYILLGGCIYSQHGTSKYNAEWMGDWTEQELINFADNSTGNYGGRIENVKETGNGQWKTGTICVYYD